MCEYVCVCLCVCVCVRVCVMQDELNCSGTLVPIF